MPKNYSMRRAAFQAVRGWVDRGWRIETSISRIRESQGMAVRDVAAASDIAATVIKRIASIDAVITAYCSRSRDKVEAELWTLAQVGVAQILFRTDIAPHAAVHETVSVADEIDKPQWKGFLNGILRSIVRSHNVQDDISFVEGLRAVATQSLDKGGWAVFEKPIVDGGPEDSEWLSRVYSLPRWLARRWLEAEWNLANTNQTTPSAGFNLDQLLRACNNAKQQWVRVNLQRQSREALVEQFRSTLGTNVTVELGDVPEAVSLQGPLALSMLPAFDQGSCSVQDITAMRAVDTLAPAEGERILDLCSAPGGKTGHIAERLAGTGHVVAADVSSSRLRRVEENVSRLQLKNVELVDVDRDGNGLPNERFDAAMVDVPCSNTGVLAKRPEVRWRIGESDLVELPELQLEILNRAAAAIVPGGRVVYSTCSIEPEENRQVVDQFLQSNKHWTLANDRLELPCGTGDGGYHALLVHAE